MRRAHKKNYWWGLVITLLWWGILAAMVWFTDPQVSIHWFMGVLFMAVLFSASLLLANSGRGLIVALAVIIWGYLKVWGIINWWGSLLLLGLLVIIEIYLWGRSDTILKKDADIKPET